MDLLDAIPEPYLIHCLQATRLLFIKMDRIVGPHWACLLVGFTLHQDRICNTFGASEALCIPFASSSTSPLSTCPLLISCPAGALVQGFCRTPLSPTPHVQSLSNPVGFTFKIDPESDCFSPLSLPPMSGPSRYTCPSSFLHSLSSGPSLAFSLLSVRSF